MITIHFIVIAIFGATMFWAGIYEANGKRAILKALAFLMASIILFTLLEAKEDKKDVPASECRPSIGQQCQGD